MTEFNARLLSGKDKLDNAGNKEWWEKNPMIYDWYNKLGDLRLTKEYFEKIDQIFGDGHSLCNNPRWPDGYILENFIPYKKIAGKKVLEIGCGAGLVASHLAKNGADLTAIDLTEQAIKITQKRFELFSLKANILQMDAEKLNFDSDSFDFVISWGVIHHSGNMKGILDEIYRVLKPNGKAYIMIYNKNSIKYQIFCRFWFGIVRMLFLHKNLEEIVASFTDGYIARHLTKPEFCDLTTMFSSVTFSFSDEIKTMSGYLLGPFRRILYPFPQLVRRMEHWLAKNWGWYMEAKLIK